MQNRAKGISNVREARKICEGWGHITDGPFYKSRWFSGKSNAVHTDLFGVFDFISYDPNTSQYVLHQVSVIDKKALKIKAIRAAGLIGYVWCRCKSGNKVYWRLFSISPSFEAEIPVGVP